MWGASGHATVIPPNDDMRIQGVARLDVARSFDCVASGTAGCCGCLCQIDVLEQKLAVVLPFRLELQPPFWTRNIFLVLVVVVIVVIVVVVAVVLLLFCSCR